VTPLRLRLPDDAALYVLLRPADLRRALDDLGGRLQSVDGDWAAPGGIMVGLLESGLLDDVDLGALKGLTRATFFERSGFDPDAVMALALLRAPQEDLLIAEGVLGDTEIVVGDLCPTARSTLVAPLRDQAAAVHYAQRRKLKAEMDDSFSWIDGRRLKSGRPPPARWRLPPLPTAATPITARLSFDRLGNADQMLSLAKACDTFARARPPRPPSGLGPRPGCDAAWAASPSNAHRLDIRMDAGPAEISVVVAMELTSQGEATVRAGLTAPQISAIPDTVALGVRMRFDGRRARAAQAHGGASVEAPHCPLYSRVGRLLTGAVLQRTDATAPSTGVLTGVTAASFDLPANPDVPLSMQGALDYGRPARALRLGSGPLGIDLEPGGEQVIKMPIIGSDLRIRLVQGEGTSRLSLGLAAPPPGSIVDRYSDRDLIGRVVIRPRELDPLAKALALFSAASWLPEWSRTDVDVLEAELRLAAPRLVAAARVRWTPPAVE
jgi:hypothetical protein